MFILPLSVLGDATILIVRFVCKTKNHCYNSARNFLFLVGHSHSYCNIVLSQFTLFISPDHDMFPLLVEGYQTINWRPRSFKNYTSKLCSLTPVSSYALIWPFLDSCSWSSYACPELIWSALVCTQWLFLSPIISTMNLPITLQLCFLKLRYVSQNWYVPVISLNLAILRK